MSDKRASTPTAAAELVTPNIEDIKNRIKFNFDKLNNTINYIIQSYRNRINTSENNPYLKNYSRIYTDYKKNIELIETNLNKYLQLLIRDKKQELSNSTDKFIGYDLLARFKENFTNEINRLEANSPLNIMKKGYSVTFLDDKKITTIKNVNVGDELTVQLIDGSLECKVNNILDKGVK